MEKLGDRLKLLRGKESQATMAQRLGIPQTTWSNYEKNRNNPDYALIDRLCTEFGVTADWLLFGRGPRFAFSRGQNSVDGGNPRSTATDRHLPDPDYVRRTEELITTQKMLIDSLQERIDELLGRFRPSKHSF